MLKSSRNIISAIELGTSKICVLIGNSNPNGQLEVIGLGEVPTEGSIVKGEIINMEEAYEQLNIALEEADRSAGKVLTHNQLSVINVTGCNIDSVHSVGTAIIRTPDQKITMNEMQEASESAKIHNMPTGLTELHTAVSYYTLDDARRLCNPEGQIATKLDAHIQIIRGNANRIENFKRLVVDTGFDENMILPIFSGTCSDMGILSKDEKERGVLLVDFGAGTTEYMVEYREGMITGGIFPIGFNHLLNDLSIGLELPFDYCQKLASSGKLEAILKSGEQFHDYPNQRGNVRHIPVSSFETIIELRLRELFGLISDELKKVDIHHNIDAGGVLTGGGSLLTLSQNIFQETFQCSVRKGQPHDVIGASGKISSPQYSMIYGALKIADYQNRNFTIVSSKSPFQTIDAMLNRLLSFGKNIKESVSI
ncbi:MAG: cell division protein FtsA [Lentisphaeria bacterium]|nr:cell division protein FtsA [Lentisphaeria bacterium]